MASAHVGSNASAAATSRAPLWSWDALLAAVEGRAEGEPTSHVTGFSIDSRSSGEGDVFVALTDRRDGHEFVSDAFKAGAAAAIVNESYLRQPEDGLLVRVDDPLKALERIGVAARQRLSDTARVFAVTGSVGKTGTKEMLRACCRRLGSAHAPEKSFNNHWGVPLTLARMPQSTQFGIFEIGMNHAGEITPLTKMVRPHIAIVTTVEPVHLEFFASVEAIADAKAEIFTGLVAGGTAILNRDNAHFERLSEKAKQAGARTLSFGSDMQSDGRLLECALAPTHSDVTAMVGGRTLSYSVGMPGRHIVQNSLGVMTALDAAGVDVERALGGLAELVPAEGRGVRRTLSVPGGEILLIDESYNANPASMRSALLTLTHIARGKFPRRIAVLGDMLELGEKSQALHQGLKQTIDDAGVDLLFACGPNMAYLFRSVEEERRGAWAEASEGLTSELVDCVRAGDVVVVKGSLGSAMAPVARALEAKFSKVD